MQTALKRNKGSKEAALKLVDEIKDKSTEQTAKILAEKFSEPLRHKIEVDEETLRILKQIKEQISHIHPDASLGEAAKYAAKALLKKNMTHFDAAAAARGAISKAAIRRKVLVRNCEFRFGNRTCGSSFQKQVDHIVPLALSGTDTFEIMRCLCRKHNMLMA